jgi:exonuclease III
VRIATFNVNDINKRLPTFCAGSMILSRTWFASKR